jgi:hypothetical protein
VNDVAIRQDKTIRADDKSRPAAAAFATASFGIALFADFDSHHGGSDQFHRARHRLRVGVEKRAIV